MQDISLYQNLEPHFSAGMSEFQMQNFVINDHLTPYRKLRQAIIESKARLESITSLGFDIEEIQIKLREAMRLTSGSDIVVELNAVAINRFKFELNRKNSMLEQLKRESAFFLDQIEKLVEVLGGREVVLQAAASGQLAKNGEQAYWTAKLARGVACEQMQMGTISRGLMESILALPEERQAAIFAEASMLRANSAKLIQRGTDIGLIEGD